MYKTVVNISVIKDGSMGQMVICKDESGKRIDCPSEEEEEDKPLLPCRVSINKYLLNLYF